LNLSPKSIAVAISVLGTLSSIGFFVVSSWGAFNFLSGRRKSLRRSRAPNDRLPGVTILKPLKGVDPSLWENFCSHCDQHYPEFQLIFGVSDVNDPAIAMVRQLQQKYPRHQIELVVCEQKLGTNTKVSTLVQMLASARHPILLVNDSDIQVPPDYLTRIVAKLHDDEVGLVTCLYRGIAGKTIGSRIEALGISTDFIPGVLSARLLENGLRFGLGSTLAFRRSDLQAIGGFEALLDYLADDYELGRRIAALGKRVELSEIVVDTFLPEYSMRRFFEHQLRWARTIRDARHWGYLGVSLTFGLAWALLTVLLTRGAAWAWVLSGLTATARAFVVWMCAKRVLQDSGLARDWYFLPVRDLIAPVVWMLSFVGNRISWRGDLYYLKQGRLTRATREASS